MKLSQEMAGLALIALRHLERDVEAGVEVDSVLESFSDAVIRELTHLGVTDFSDRSLIRLRELVQAYVVSSKEPISTLPLIEKFVELLGEPFLVGRLNSDDIAALQRAMFDPRELDAAMRVCSGSARHCMMCERRLDVGELSKVVTTDGNTLGLQCIPCVLRTKQRMFYYKPSGERVMVKLSEPSKEDDEGYQASVYDIQTITAPPGWVEWSPTQDQEVQVRPRSRTATRDSLRYMQETQAMNSVNWVSPAIASSGDPDENI